MKVPTLRKSTPTQTIESYEEATLPSAGQTLNLTRTHGGSMHRVADFMRYQTLVLMPSGGGWGRNLTHNQSATHGHGQPDLFRSRQDDDRIDSTELRRALTAAVDLPTPGGRSPPQAYINGTTLVVISESAVLSAPLTIPCLAAAMRGTYLSVSIATVEVMARVLVADEYRQAHNIPASSTFKPVSATARVDAGEGTFMLCVETTGASLALEAQMRVRNHFNEPAITALLTHEAQTVGTLDTEALAKAYLKSIRALPDAERRCLMDSKYQTRGEWETYCTMALRVTDDGVDVARVVCDGSETPDDASWPFMPVAGARVDLSPEAPAFRLIDGTLMSFLRGLDARVSFGLSADEGPVLFWTDDGIQLAASAATVQVMS